jgi:hypothetical protein
MPKESKRHPGKYRVFPNLETDFYCLAVRLHDELFKLIKTKDLSKQDIDKLREITNMLVLIKKTLPATITKRAKKDTGLSFAELTGIENPPIDASAPIDEDNPFGLKPSNELRIDGIE